MIIQETPTLNAQFDKARNDSDMLSLIKSFGGTFTRGSEVVGSGASVASYVDALGILRYAKLGHPRPNFVDGVNQGLLIEEARTNLLERSEEFGNAYWTKTNSTITDNDTTAPDGESTADKLVEDTSTGTHLIQRNVTASNGSYTYQVFAKADTVTNIRLQITDLTTGDFRLDYDFETDTISENNGGSRGSWTSFSYKKNILSNGWVSLSITGVKGAGTQIGCQVFLLNSSGNSSYLGDGTSGLFIFGADLQAGSFPTSYIPTAGTTVTRGVETALRPSATDIINASEGTLYAECDLRVITRASTFRRVLVLDNGGEDNSVYVRVTESNLVQLIVFSGGVAQAVIASTASVGNTKIVATYKLNEFKLYVNGVLSGSDSLGVLPIGLDTIRLGRSNAATVTHFLNDELTKAILYPKALTEAEALLLSRL